MNRDVHIIGGGLAGLAAAMQIIDAGDRPIIHESRRKLGGRATSFDDPRSDTTLDNCQHVLMGCCTNLQDLYQRLGVLDTIDWHDTLYWLGKDGKVDVLKPGMLPAPLHHAGSLRRMKLLDADSKSEIRRASWKLLRLGHLGRMRWQFSSFRDWLDHAGQSERTRTLFWEPIVTSACNLPCDRVAAVHAMQVFQESFLPSSFAGHMGLPSIPLRELYDPAEEMIRNAGGRIELGTSVRSISFDDQQVRGIVTNDGPIEAALVISTVPPNRLSKLIPQRWKERDARLGALNQFEFSPILGVHLLFDSSVIEYPHLVLPGRSVQWLFNKGCNEDGQQHVHAVISAADAWMELDEDAIVDRVLDDLSGVAPHIRTRTIVHARSVKEKRATFAATAEIEPLRPSAGPSSLGVEGGDAQGLYLAGDWCATGWPATMEGAVRSGYLAVQAMTGHGGLVDELPPGRLARWLSGS